MRKENITLEELQSCPEFEGMPEEMAQKMLGSLNMFCDILSAKCLEDMKGKEW